MPKYEKNGLWLWVGPLIIRATLSTYLHIFEKSLLHAKQHNADPQHRPTITGVSQRSKSPCFNGSAATTYLNNVSIVLDEKISCLKSLTCRFHRMRQRRTFHFQIHSLHSDLSYNERCPIEKH